jgi:hypothetical protein
MRGLSSGLQREPWPGATSSRASSEVADQIHRASWLTLVPCKEGGGRWCPRSRILGWSLLLLAAAIATSTLATHVLLVSRMNSRVSDELAHEIGEFRSLAARHAKPADSQPDSVLGLRGQNPAGGAGARRRADRVGGRKDYSYQQQRLGRRTRPEPGPAGTLVRGYQADRGKRTAWNFLRGSGRGCARLTAKNSSC